MIDAEKLKQTVTSQDVLNYTHSFTNHAWELSLRRRPPLVDLTSPGRWILFSCQECQEPMFWSTDWFANVFEIMSNQICTSVCTECLRTSPRYFASYSAFSGLMFWCRCCLRQVDLCSCPKGGSSGVPSGNDSVEFSADFNQYQETMELLRRRMLNRYGRVLTQEEFVVFARDGRQADGLWNGFWDSLVSMARDV